MSRETVQLAAYLATLTVATILTLAGKLDSHLLALVLGAGLPGPGMLFQRSGASLPPPKP